MTTSGSSLMSGAVERQRGPSLRGRWWQRFALAHERESVSVSTGDLLLGYDFLSRSVRELDLSDDESQGSLRIEEFVP